MIRLVALALVATACGRIGFDPVVPGSGGDGGGGSGSNFPDATTACVSDGFCSPTCGAADPDCQTTCGDGKCVGNAGELCTTCTADCKTTMDVCGNGTCGPSENGTTCFSDCGPVPWTWAQDELDLLTAINQARTGGTSCGGMAATTAPAVVMDANLRASARDITWEEAHLGASGINRCDGQNLIVWLGSTGANSSTITTSPTTTPARLAAITGSTMSCNTLMNASFTVIGVGIAIDSNSEMAVFYK